MDVECQICGRKFHSPTGRAKYCKRPGCTRQTAYKKRANEPTVSELPSAQSAQGLVATTRAALADAGQLDTPLGQLAVSHAELLASSRAVMGRAPLAKELRDTLVEAMKDAGHERNTLDEINESAAAKLAALALLSEPAG